MQTEGRVFTGACKVGGPSGARLERAGTRGPVSGPPSWDGRSLSSSPLECETKTFSSQQQTVKDSGRKKCVFPPVKVSKVEDHQGHTSIQSIRISWKVIL